MSILGRSRLPARLDLADPIKSSAVMGQPVSREPLPPTDDQPVRGLLGQDIGGLVVGDGIGCPQGRRLLAADADQLGIPSGDRGCVRLRLPFNVGEQLVIVALQHLMGPGAPAKIEHQLQCTDRGGRTAKQQVPHIDEGCHVRDSGRAEKNDQQVEHPAPALQHTAPGRVVEAVAQDIEADVVDRAAHLLPCLSGGVPSLAEGAWFTVGAGLGGRRGPIEFSEICVPSGTSVVSGTLSDFSSDMFVSSCGFHLGMSGAGLLLQAGANPFARVRAEGDETRRINLWKGLAWTSGAAVSTQLRTMEAQHG